MSVSTSYARLTPPTTAEASLSKATVMGRAQALFPERYAEACFLRGLFESVLRVRPGELLMAKRASPLDEVPVGKAVREQIQEFVTSATPEHLRDNPWVKQLAARTVSVFAQRFEKILTRPDSIKLFSASVCVQEDHSVDPESLLEGAIQNGLFDRENCTATIYARGRPAKDVHTTLIHELIHSFEEFSCPDDLCFSGLPRTEIITYFGANRTSPDISQMYLRELLVARKENSKKLPDLGLIGSIELAERIRDYSLLVKELNTTIPEDERILAAFFLQRTPLDQANDIASCLGTTLQTVRDKFCAQVIDLKESDPLARDPNTVLLLRKFYPPNGVTMLAQAFHNSVLPIITDPNFNTHWEPSNDLLSQIMEVAQLSKALEVTALLTPKAPPSAKEVKILTGVHTSLKKFLKKQNEIISDDLELSSALTSLLKQLVTDAVCHSVDALSSVLTVSKNHLMLPDSPTALWEVCDHCRIPYPLMRLSTDQQVKESSVTRLRSILERYIEKEPLAPTPSLIPSSTPCALPYLDQVLSSFKRRAPNESTVRKYLKALHFLGPVAPAKRRIELIDTLLTRIHSDSDLSDHSRTELTKGSLRTLAVLPAFTRSADDLSENLSLLKPSTVYALIKDASFSTDLQSPLTVSTKYFSISEDRWVSLLLSLDESTELSSNARNQVKKFISLTRDRGIATGMSAKLLQPLFASAANESELPWKYGKVPEGFYDKRDFPLTECAVLVHLFSSLLPQWSEEKRSFYTALANKGVEKAIKGSFETKETFALRHILLQAGMETNPELTERLLRSYSPHVLGSLIDEVQSYPTKLRANYYTWALELPKMDDEEFTVQLKHLPLHSIPFYLNHYVRNFALRQLNKYSFLSTEQLDDDSLFVISPSTVSHSSLDTIARLGTVIKTTSDGWSLPETTKEAVTRSLTRTQEFVLAAIARQGTDGISLSDYKELFSYPGTNDQPWLYGPAPIESFATLNEEEITLLYSALEPHSRHWPEEKKTYIDALACQGVERALKGPLSNALLSTVEKALTSSEKARLRFAESFSSLIEELKGEDPTTIGYYGTLALSLSKHSEEASPRIHQALEEIILMPSFRRTPSLNALARPLVREKVEESSSLMGSLSVEDYLQWLRIDLHERFNRGEFQEVLNDCQLLLQHTEQNNPFSTSLRTSAALLLRKLPVEKGTPEALHRRLLYQQIEMRHRVLANFTHLIPKSWSAFPTTDPR